MSTTCNDVYLGLPDDDYFGLLGDDDLLPPPLPMGFDLPRKPPVNAAVHFCETQTPGRSDNHAAAAAEAKHGGSGAVAEEHCDVGVEYCSPYLKSGSEEETDCCGVGAAHHYWKHSMEEWSDRGTSLLDKDTERFKYLNGGQSRGDDSRAGDQQAAHRQEVEDAKLNFRLLGPLMYPRWKRALLKIGGSVLAGSTSENVDPKMIMLIAREVQVASLRGVQVAIVVGSRNIYCGDTWAAETGIQRAATNPIG
nr:unnamed protein product [Digitaria exilis]